ncbi:MAG: glycosyltransferase family 4 protein [Bauldia litoralis]
MAAQARPGGGFGLTVLQVLPTMDTGGVERGTVDVAAAVAAAGGTAYVASAGGALSHELTRVGAKHVALPVDTKNPLAMRRNVDRLAAAIEALNVDVVHARSRAPAWSARAAARKTGRPFVTTFHGTYNFSGPLKRRYNSIMASGDTVIAISNFIRDHIVEVYGTPVERIRVIHRGVDFERLDPAAVPSARVIQLATDWQLPDGAPVIMMPGRLTRWKGQTVFLEALAKLGRDDFVALIVGGDQGREAYNRELRGLAEKLGVQGRVWFVGHCADMPAALMLSDVVVSASTDPEAFGRVLVEAQAMGRPVIGTDHGGSRETVLPGETGWLVPPGDADELARAIDAALSLDAGARQDMARKAEAHVRAHFDRVRMCAETLEVYREAVARGPRPA